MAQGAWLLCCLFFLALNVASGQEGLAINTGEGLQSLLFPALGGVELAVSAQNRTTLTQNLPLSFSFEAWVMLPNPPNDGYYKTITGRWDIGPDGTFHNRWNDWDFQVQASGNLNFFFGNGLPTNYGVLIDCGNLVQGVWSHVAFTVSTSSFNPDIVRVYYDLRQFNQTWRSGNRQVPLSSRNRNIFLGDYFNQDGDHKWWRGYMDEVRFWGSVRTPADLAQYRQRVVPPTTSGLLAYYRFNEGAGVLLRDTSLNQFHGRLSKVTPTLTAPVWRVSGAKIHVDFNTFNSSIVTVALPGLSNKGPLGFTYVIESLPTASDSFGFPADGGRLIGDGKYITTTPFALNSNLITIEASNTSGLVASFSYYGRDTQNPSSREPFSTIVYITVGAPACNPDSCGVCNGDNSTCSCLPMPFNGYSLNDIERIVLLYEIENTLEALNSLGLKVDVTLATLSQHQATELQVLVSQVQNFVTNCLNAFCDKLAKYGESYRALAPLVVD